MTLSVHGECQVATKTPKSLLFPILKQLVGFLHVLTQRTEEVWSQKCQIKVEIAACDAHRLIYCCFTVLLSSQETASLGISEKVCFDALLTEQRSECKATFQWLQKESSSRKINSHVCQRAGHLHSTNVSALLTSVFQNGLRCTMVSSATKCEVCIL